MAWARSRRLASGTWYYMVTEDRREHPAGKGKEGRDTCEAWVAAYNKARRAERAGMPVEEPFRRCSWTLKDLCLADMTDAKRRGLKTTQPQFQGKISKRESHWRNLIGFFGEDVNLDAITGERIRAYIEARERDAGPAAINRDLYSVLRPALNLARRHEESGYTKDPFSGIRRLEERKTARQPVALTEAQVKRLLAACRAVDRRLGAYVELLFLTASRLREEPTVDGKFLRYAAYKGGLPRSFRLRGRLAYVARLPRTFDRRMWRRAVEAAKLPEVRPHDLRHTALTIEGNRPGASLLSVQKLGGWRSPSMAARYLHPDRAAIDAVSFARPDPGRNRKPGAQGRIRASR